MKVFKLISEQKLSYMTLGKKNIFILNNDLSKEQFLNLVPFNLKDDIVDIKEVNFSEQDAYNKLCQFTEDNIKNIYILKDNKKDFQIEIYREENYLNYISTANKTPEYYKAHDMLSELSKAEIYLLMKKILPEDSLHLLYKINH